jgi:hypothetical protein
MTMPLLERIELRRFVGRELLLWLWFESELFEATLSTKEHGSFGLWLEGRLVLDEGRESTTIKGSQPGHHREAKEALLRGKTPSRVGLHVSFGDKEVTVTLRGDTLAFAGLSGPGKKAGAEDEGGEGGDDAVTDLTRARRPRGPRKASAAETARLAADEEHEAFYDRMHHARDVEALFEALYRDFLTLRLAAAWDRSVVPALQAWASGDRIDEDAYVAARARVLGRPRARA